ncbi:MAG: (Fe-S)-binding protein [Gemmatimonadales bacterium]
MTPDATAGLDPCVHCGFCLQACPTYIATGDEADSPRGRILLIKELDRGRLSITEPAVAHHLDRCLGCLACEPVCPSGVRYGPALERARRLLLEARPLPLAAQLLLAAVAEARIRRPLTTAARLARPLARRLAGPSRLGFLFGTLGATRGGNRLWRQPRRRQASSSSPVPPAAAAALFVGCIMEGLFSHVHAATRRVLLVNGYATVRVREQVCCGALHAHAGLHEEAVALARRNVTAFAAEPELPIVVNAAGCGAMLKGYGDLLSGDVLAAAAKEFSSRVRDVTELLAERGPRRGAPLALRIAHDPPCHLLHAQRLTDPPEQMLGAIPEITPISYEEASECCGGAGSYFLVQPELSREVLDRKIEALATLRPDVVVTGNPGCVMQIGAGLRAKGLETDVLHPVELLDGSYAIAGFYGS